jgi:glucosamine-6-phosphate deaminase
VDSLTVRVFDSRAEMGEAAAAACAAAMAEALKRKDEINMVFAAAPSQNEFLAGLRQRDFSRVNAFHMDEYAGLPHSAPQRFAAFLTEALFGRVKMRSVNLMNSEADAEAECARYSSLLESHPCDIMCMGVGENGHIAFNDPHVANFHDPKRVKVVELDEVCRMQQVHDGCFEKLEDVPKRAMTLTVPTLVAPDVIFCVVPAKTKARAVRAMLKGPISEACPASILRTRAGATLWLDADSASLLS